MVWIKKEWNMSVVHRLYEHSHAPNSVGQLQSSDEIVPPTFERFVRFLVHELPCSTTGTQMHQFFTDQGFHVNFINMKTPTPSICELVTLSASKPFRVFEEDYEMRVDLPDYRTSCFVEITSNELFSNVQTKLSLLEYDKKKLNIQFLNDKKYDFFTSCSNFNWYSNIFKPILEFFHPPPPKGNPLLQHRDNSYNIWFVNFANEPRTKNIKPLHDLFYFIQLAVSIKGFILNSTGSLCNHKLIVVAAKESFIRIFEKMPQIASTWFSKYRGFKCIPHQFRKDIDVATAAVGADGLLLRFASTKFKQNKNIVLTAFSNNVFSLKHASSVLLQSKEFMLEVVRKVGRTLKYASDSLKDDRELVATSIEQSWDALCYVSDRLRDDKELTLLALSKSGLALQYAAAQYRNDKEMVLMAIERNWNALQYASDTLRNDKFIVITAVKKNRQAIEFASSALKDDKELILLCGFKECDKADDALKLERDLVLKTMSKNWNVVRYASSALKNDKEFALAAVRISPKAISSLSESMQKDVDVLRVCNECS